MRTEIAIDPNVRVKGNATYAGFEDVLRGHLRVGEEVTVRETEGDLIGTGRITEIDITRKLVYLAVDWASLHPRKETETFGGDFAASAQESPFLLLTGGVVFIPSRLTSETLDVFPLRPQGTAKELAWVGAR